MDVYQRRRLVALSALIGVFVIIVLLVKSCGGDDEGSVPAITNLGETTTPEATTMAKKDYIDEADGICDESNTALAAIDASDASAAAGQETEIVSGELDQLQTLPQPDEDADAANRFLRALQDQVSALQDREAALQANDADAASQAEASEASAEADAQAAAEEFGFKVCGNPPETGGAVAPTTTPTTTTPLVPVAPAPTTPPAGGAGTGGGATPGGGGGATGGGTGGTGSGSGGVSP